MPEADVHSSGLEALYAWMQASIMDGPEAHALDPAIAREIKPNSRQSAARRMEVYTNDFYSRFRDVLAVDFTAVSKALGREAWSELTQAFVRAHPSRTPNINNYGYELVDFMREYPLEHREFLIELARLEVEIARRHGTGPEAFIGPEAFGEMTEEDWEQASLLPRASVDSFAFNFDVLSFLNAVNNDESPEVPITPEPDFVQVYRKGDETWRQALSPARHALLQALKRGTPLGEALEEAASHAEVQGDEFSSEVQSWFGDWMSDGIFAEIKRPS